MLTDQPLAISPQLSAINFALNSAFEPSPISAPEIAAVVEAWRGKAISRDTMLEYFKRRELIPEGRTIAEEKALVNRS